MGKEDDSIDADGYRANVGIIVANNLGKVLLAGRHGRRGWQFPQGGIKPDEAPEQAMLRELHEELGLRAADIDILGATSDWIRYRLPKRYVRKNSMPLCIGQKQIWYALRLRSTDDAIVLDATDEPEFDRWRWVDFWRPVNEVIYFKRRVYARALHELGEHVFLENVPRQPAWWPARWRRAFEKDLQKARLGQMSGPD